MRNRCRDRRSGGGACSNANARPKPARPSSAERISSSAAYRSDGKLIVARTDAAPSGSCFLTGIFGGFIGLAFTAFHHNGEQKAIVRTAPPPSGFSVGQNPGLARSIRHGVLQGPSFVPLALPAGCCEHAKGAHNQAGELT